MNTRTKITELCKQKNIKLRKIGVVVEDEFNINGVVSTNVATITKKYEEAIPSLMKN